MEKFATRLKELRIEKNLTQDQLSAKTGISQGAISAYEVGLRIPKIDIFVMLVKFFNCSPGYLLGIED